jgi:hypothetical protein
MEGKLKAMSNAAAVVAAIQVAFASVDVAAVIKDLQSSRSGEVWSATVIPAKVHLEPSEATVTQNQVSASFTASVGGSPDGAFVYRWRTTGIFGIISDNAGKQGKNFDSTQKTVYYMVNPGAMINGQLDTITVEVFDDDGSGTIPYGAVSIGKATSKVLGDRGDTIGDVETRGETWLFTTEGGGYAYGGMVFAVWEGSVRDYTGRMTAPGYDPWYVTIRARELYTKELLIEGGDGHNILNLGDGEVAYGIYFSVGQGLSEAIAQDTIEKIRSSPEWQEYLLWKLEIIS